ncbi:coiled-coil domain-containing protein [Brachionus plicatilis]|uniref:Coiled-coil domain-containing protein n=1 Tax=Brachionus plicatilis TaxID=10195 RepID=A0A3M7T1D0_BRAPC|nr:coiled-coil domain-containing protein [Brachionus plicatilis]
MFKQYESGFMEFIYLSLIHFDFSFQNQKINLSNTFRRIGEELLKSVYNYRQNEGAGDEVLNLEDPKSRMLACLTILRTLSQVDLIIQVLELVKQDLKDEDNKKLFLSFHGTWTVIKWCKLGNQVVLNLAIDVYLLMSIEWKLVGKFLESCSNENWFSQISIVLRNSNVNSSPSANSNCLDLRVIEKISILMQKLSKIRSNKKYFDMFSLTNIFNDLLKRFGHDIDY